MMKTDDIYLNESKEALIRQYKGRIFHVFNVDVTFSENDELRQGNTGVDCGTKICLSSVYAQENIEEAKSYISSLTAEGEDFSKIVQNFSVEVLGMVQENQTTIEKKSQAVVDVLQESCQICIFGQVKNVSRAQNLIKEMVHQDSPAGDIRTRGGLEQNNQNGLFSSSRTQFEENYDGNTKEIRFPKCDDDLNSSSDELLHLYDEGNDENNRSETEIRCARTLNKSTVRTSPCHSPLAQECSNSDLLHSSNDHVHVAVIPVHKLNLSSQISSSTSSEDEIEKVELDPRYSTKIEFALKLGYSEVQLAQVLQKIGPDAGQNEILSELIKLGTSDDCQNLSDDNWAYPVDDAPVNSTERTSPLPEVNLKKLDIKRDSESNLRPIVIDGSNVAMSHGNKEIFSCRGIQLAVEWFQERGHSLITVFVPQWRKETSRPDSKIKDQEILTQLEREKILVFTPARRIGGKRVVCYDDRYILNLASENGGIVVSNDNYRDLVNEKPEYRKVVEERLLMYSFVNDRFMPPDDPLGRHGPNLDNFLCKEPRQPESLPPPCPYGSKKCTYGNKCKFYHPERGSVPQKSVTDKLAEHARQKIQEVRERGTKSTEGEKKKQPLSKKQPRGKMALQRTQSLVTSSLPPNFINDQPQLIHGGDLGELCADDTLRKQEVKDPEKEEKLKLYNEKLSEYRKRVEQAEMEVKLRKGEETILSGQNGDGSSGQVGYPDQMSLSLRSDQSGSRSSSPLQRSSPSPQLKPQEQFLSGHLLLAKKLSDEAGDSKYHKMAEERKFTKSPPSTTYTKSPLAITQTQQVPVQQHKQLVQHHSLTLQQHKNHHQQLSQQLSQPLLQQGQTTGRHQKLSRQYSLQGNQDPRLKTGLHAQSSCDPRLLQYPKQYQQQYSRGLYRSSSNNSQQQNYHLQDMTNSPFHLEQQQFANVQSHLGARAHQNRFVESNMSDFSLSGNRLPMEHTALSRMQSAPEVPHTRKTESTTKGFGRMVRQNSSSDTQLHLIGDSDQGQVDYCLFPGGYKEKAFSNDSFGSLDNASVFSQPSEGHHVQSRLMVGPGTSEEYRTKHQSGETRWTFDPVFDPGSNLSCILPKQGVDALESDFPSSGFRQRGGGGPWHHEQMSTLSNAQSDYTSQFPTQDCRVREQYTPTNAYGKRLLTRFSSNNERSTSSGFPGQTVDHGDVGTSNTSYHPMPYPLQASHSTLGYIGQEQRSVKRCSPPSVVHQQLDTAMAGNTAEPRGIPILGASAAKRDLPDDAPIHPTDKRYGLYYHLCGLFRESTVRAVMNQHPEEMNPQELCAYIIGAK